MPTTTSHRAPAGAPRCLATVLLLAAALGATSATQAGVLGRDQDTVVVEGAELAALQGLDPGRVVAFKFDSGWVQIPLQIDERAVVDFGDVYNRPPSGFTFLSYTDAGTFTGPDPDPTFDADDELVFRAADVAAMWDGSPEPLGVVAGSMVELLVTDLSDGDQAYAYLFESDGTLQPSAGAPDIDYRFVLLSGDYKSTYGTESGPNPENSTVTTASYAMHFSDRWIRDETSVTDGGATGVDILDRHKVLFGPGNCVRSEDSFSAGEGAFIVNKRGPVRALRGYVGANSGVTTHRIHAFYAEREEIVTVLRVHAIPGMMNYFDYAPAATGMSYRNDLNPSPVTIDGAADVVTPGEVSWEMVTGAQGTLAIAWLKDTDIPGFAHTWYYSDAVNPPTPQCTGDGSEYGASGFWKNDGVPNTDPANTTDPQLFEFAGIQVIKYGSPNQANAFAERNFDEATSPLAVSVDPRNVCPDADRDGWAVCDGVCQPGGGDLCGDCDDTRPEVNPGGAEVCGNGVDEDCDGQDPACAVCPDADNDGWADCDPLCLPDPADLCDDCDDADPGVNPAATEVCDNGLDEDCDGFDFPCNPCPDEDQDGWAVCDGICTPAPGDQCGDCNDNTAAVNPGRTEICGNGIDEDCDGQAQPCLTCDDADDDGFAVCDGLCTPEPGDLCGDCDDSAAGANPAASEGWDLPASCSDGLDNDCDGNADALDAECALTSARIDFGPSGALLEPGYQRDAGAPFSSVRGFGWLGSGTLPSRDRGCGQPPLKQRTFVFTAEPRTWEVEAINGDYDVTLSVGDCSFAQGPQQVVVEGRTVVADERTAAGAFLVRTRRVAVRDGRLSVTIGGAGPGRSVLNHVDVAPSPVQPPFLLSINFQAPGAATPPGFEADAGAPFDPLQGRGWSRDMSGNARVRGVNQDRLLDSLIFAGSFPATYEVELAPGTYDVDLAVGDPSFSQGPQRVVVQGIALIDGQTTAANEFLRRHTRVTVTGSRLKVELGGLAGRSALNFLTLSRASPFELLVNFQPAASAVPSGYRADSGGTYSLGRAYGWSRALGSQTRERNLVADQRRDTLLFVGSQAESWEAEVPPGDYEVSVTVGDPAFAQGPQMVLVEGEPLFAGETTMAAEFLQRSTRVPVRDGRVTLTVGGGSAGFTTIDHVEVRSVANLASINFQPLAAAVPAGHDPDWGAPFSASRGYGWDVGIEGQTRDRNLLADQALDTLIFAQQTPRTWELRLPGGDYQVALASGDAAFRQGPQRLVLEGVSVFDGVFTPAGSFRHESRCVNVADGALTLQIGGLSGTTVLNLLRVTGVSCSGTGSATATERSPTATDRAPTALPTAEGLGPAPALHAR